MMRLGLLPCLWIFTIQGCAVTTNPIWEYQVEQQIRTNQTNAENLAAVARADKTNSEAKGTKTCVIRQWPSAYKTKAAMGSAIAGGVRSYYKMSNTNISVARDGRIGIAVTEDIYPGTKQYFLIGGKRYSGKGDHYVWLDAAAKTALTEGKVIKYNWQDWPYRAEHNDEDAYAGFNAAYQECLSFLRS